MVLEYTQMERIGKEIQGTVFKGKNKSTGELVAMKEIPIDEIEGIPGTTMREIAIVTMLKHPNIIELHHVVQQENKITLVFEYCSQDLGKHMQQYGRQGRLYPNTVRTLMHQLLQGIALCHEQNFHHRNLRPATLLIDGKGVLKISDFGYAGTFHLPVNKRNREAVTLWYRAPELLCGSTSCTASVDIWSIGCIFAELLSGKPLFKGRDNQAQLESIVKITGMPSTAQYQKMKSECSDIQIPKFRQNYTKVPLQQMIPGAPRDAMNLLGRLLKFDPAERISAAKALDHPYFGSLRQQRKASDAFLPLSPYPQLSPLNTLFSM